MPRKFPTVPTMAEMKAFLDRAKGYQEQFTPGFYHGSPSNKIKAFDPNKGSLSGVKEEEKIVPNVTFVTPKPEFAESFLPEGFNTTYRTGSTIYPVSVNLGKHFDANTPEGSDVIKQYLLNKYKKEADTYGFDDMLSQKHEHYMDKLTDPINNWKLLENPEILKHLQSSGHDTFSVTEGGVKNIGVFKPQNIRGKFANYNPDEAMNPDFMKAEGGAVEHFEVGGKVGNMLTLLNKLGLSEESIAAWKAANSVNQRQTRNPILQQAAKDLAEGKITSEHYRALARTEMPINPFTEVPNMPSQHDIANALKSNQLETGIIGVNKDIAPGTRVSSRLDIPAYDKYDKWIVSLHDPLDAGRSIGYGQTAHLKGPIDFTASPKAGHAIATGRADKTTYARIHGDWEPTNPEDVYKRAQDLMDNPEWAQVGLNPFRHSYFYDKADMAPVIGGQEALQVGPLVLVKKPQKVDPDDPMFRIAKDRPETFANGGPVEHFEIGGKVGFALDLAKKIAPKFDINAVQNMPVGSAAKQIPVAKAFQMLSSENVDPAIKSKIFQDYVSKHPSLIKKSGATNYDELTQAAYEKMVKETKDQYDLMTGSGIKIDWDPTGAKSYKNSAEMLKDAAENKHLTVFQGGESHPLIPGKSNEQFRAVHDYFGHGTTGSSFGPKGEELAYGAHSQMYSPLARLAAATETRGQNSFVNYSGINDELIKKMNEARAGGASPEELQQLGQQWQYAPQKGLILPAEQVDINYKGYSAGGEIIKQALQHAKQIPFVHFSKAENISRLEPAMYGTGIKGAEGVRLQDAPDIKPRSYFYVDRPDVRPEQGLGSVKYSGVSQASYPLHEDPAGYYKIAKELAKDPFFAKQGKEIIDRPKMLNEVERAIKNAGYTGYHTDDAGILFHPTDVTRATD